MAFGRVTDEPRLSIVVNVPESILQVHLRQDFPPAAQYYRCTRTSAAHVTTGRYADHRLMVALKLP
jgi:hypothetical protein